MNNMAYKKLPKCPVETTMLFLKDRDSIIILGYILLGVLERCELLKMTAMSEKTYQKALDALLENGLITCGRNVLPTELGKSFSPVIMAMADWGEKYKTQQKN